MYRVTVSLPGCPDVADSFYIDVQPNPVLYAGGNHAVCQFDTLHLHASVTPNWYTHYTYGWSPTTSLDDPTQPTVIFTPGADTKYYVTVTTPHGCSSIDSAFITVHLNNFAKLDTSYTLCPHDSVQLQPSGGVFYIWHPGMYLSDSTSASPWVHAITSISYTAIATSQYGCLDTVTTHVTIQPQAHIYLEDSIDLYPGQTYQVNLQTNCTYFTWFPVAGLDNAYISNPVITPVISSKYIVHGKTEWGCEAVDSISVNLKETIFGLPNAFTPGAGVNNKLQLIKLGNGTLNYFRIYNRWGNKVFETSNINEGWDGTFHGTPQPYDVYVYEIEAVSSDGNVIKKYGNVTLIR
jgi:gliding motility-associated-like protein